MYCSREHQKEDWQVHENKCTNALSHASAKAHREILRQSKIWEEYKSNYQKSPTWETMYNNSEYISGNTSLMRWLFPTIGTRSELWGNFARFQKGDDSGNLLAQAIEKFRQEGKDPGFAVDLGAGKGFATLSLLEKQWKVIAVDSSQSAIQELRKMVGSRMKQLTVVPNEVEDYAFPQNIRLIHARDIFSYCDPSKMNANSSSKCNN